MNILYIMVPLSLFLGLSFVAGYVWAVTNGQFDDTTTPACEILIDEDEMGEQNVRK